MIELLPFLEQELSRRDFWAFCNYYDPEFFEKRDFLKEPAEALQEIAEGKIDALSISMPPRAGKSYLTSLFCAWVLGRWPEESVMRNTCTAALYQKFSYDVRAIFKSEKFREVFPDAQLSPDKSNINGWNTTESKQVGYFGAGVGGTIIGFGASKVAITDDLYRGMEDALSDTINERVHQWKEGSHDSRFEKGCRRVDIGTRWTRDDVIGRTMERGEYDKSIVIKALDDQEKSFCEDVLTTEQYLKKRAKTRPEIWKAEYQQEPVDIEGRLFSGLQTITKEEFKRISTPDPANPQHKNKSTLIEGAVAYIDVADQGADYTAAAVGAIIGETVYITEVLYSRDNIDVTQPQAAAMLNRWNVSYARVESNSMGAVFARTLQKNTRAKILQVHNQQNKITRIIMQSAFILQNFVFVEGSGAGYELFIDNVEHFSKDGKNKHDDAPDCLSGLSMFITAMFKTKFN